MAQEPVKQNESKQGAGGSNRPASSTQGSQPRRYGGNPRGGRQQNRGGQRRPYQQRRRFHRRKVCLFCVDKSKEINWKKPDNLRRFIGDNGSIYPRRKSGLCARHQRRVAVAIKRARHLALFPYTTEHVRIMGRS